MKVLNQTHTLNQLKTKKVTCNAEAASFSEVKMVIWAFSLINSKALNAF